jgi:type I restriction-modification system DNA methylase subunit
LARTIARIFSDESVGDQNVVRNVPVSASGYNLKDVLTIINSIRFDSDDDIYTISQKKGVSALLGTMNMVLHRVATPNITRTNTLEESVKGSVSGRFDVVLTNPPFGGTEGGHIQQNFPVKSNATELLFLEHIIKKLKHTPDARCGMVVPEGTLFRGARSRK